MVTLVDVLVIGGGIAGLSAAARIAERAGVVVLERESALGYHSSGRSATFAHFGIGDDVVRGLTAASLDFLQSPPAEFGSSPLSVQRPALFIATQAQLPELEQLHRDMKRHTDTIRRIGPDEVLDLVPVLKTGPDATVAGLIDVSGRKLDSDALLQSHARLLKARGGRVVHNAEALTIQRQGDWWQVDTAGESFAAATLVNAAGAWADQVALMAGARPLGLTPLRRTIIGFAPPEGLDISAWPFTKTVIDDGFYILPDAGLLLASPMDATPSDPCDAQPEDLDVSLAAWRVEEATSLKVERIRSRWAGLRSFVADKVPTAGFAPDAPGFFWLAGQGGYGLQTAPAMALAVEALLFGLPWPRELAGRGVQREQITPERLLALHA